MSDCIFCKIAAGEIPSEKLYEDSEMCIFRDISPIAKIHLLCVPKEHFANLSELNLVRANLIGRMLRRIEAHKEEFGLSDGYRIVINNGKNAGQTVEHLHIHILGGEVLPWEK